MAENTDDFVITDEEIAELIEIIGGFSETIALTAVLLLIDSGVSVPRQGDEMPTDALKRVAKDHPMDVAEALLAAKLADDLLSLIGK